MMRKLIVLALVAFTASCVSPGDFKRDAKCQAWGAKPGTDAYVACRAQLDAARPRARFCQPSGGGFMCL